MPSRISQRIRGRRNQYNEHVLHKPVLSTEAGAASGVGPLRFGLRWSAVCNHRAVQAHLHGSCRTGRSGEIGPLPRQQRYGRGLSANTHRLPAKASLSSGSGPRP